MPPKKTKMLYIAGCDRSGSTVLDQVLGQLPEWFTVGEVADFWDRGARQLCGCGHFLLDCDFWCQVFVTAFQKTPDQFDFAAVSDLRNHCARSRHLYLMTNRSFRRFVEPAIDRYIDVIEKLYSAISAIAGAKVLVDSSKLPSHAYLLEQTSTVELFVLHLIRDPRGCAYSWLKSKKHVNPAVGDFPHWHPAKTAINWICINRDIKKLWGHAHGRYLALRYEDFIARPEYSVRLITQLVGEDVIRLPFLSQHCVSLAPTHGVSGNTVRFDNGAVQLKLDDKWRRALSPMHKLLVTTLTGASLPGYGYRFGGGSKEDVSGDSKQLRPLAPNAER